MSEDLQKNDEHWREKLSADEFRICRLKGTEPAFTGKYWNTKTSGVYHCKCCDRPLFSSQTKFDSGSGWPSFFQPLGDDEVKEQADRSHGMLRTEILCRHCDSHLGHVFTDGPRPTGLRYCVNSASLDFVQDTDRES